jgi:8-oxo-dGTP pyrophosphatase MutT (NUDIX family)
MVTLSKLINESTTSWKETEWEFPKGKKNYQEHEIMCAIREFEEETGNDSSKLFIIENLAPFEEIFMGTNNKTYKNKYFIGYMKDNINKLDNFQKNEISKIEWKTLDACLKSIRPYHFEKKQLIININSILNKYQII